MTKYNNKQTMEDPAVDLASLKIVAKQMNDAGRDLWRASMRKKYNISSFEIMNSSGLILFIFIIWIVSVIIKK